MVSVLHWILLIVVEMFWTFFSLIVSDVRPLHFSHSFMPFYDVTLRKVDEETISVMFSDN